MARCFICKRNELDIMVLKLPLEASYENDVLEVLGNVRANEHICLSCLGYQFDEVIEKRLKFEFIEPF